MKIAKPPYFCTSLLILLIAALSAGCGQLDPAPVETAPAATGAATRAPVAAPAVSGYPAGATPTPFDYTQEEGYPAPATSRPAEELPASLEIPEPAADRGVVTGQLLTPGPGGSPYIGSLYLASTIASDQEGFPPIVAFSDQVDPLAIQDQSGRFLFSDIAPGNYALVIWNPVASTVIEEPGTNDYMVFEVKAGEVTDLGVIGIP
jgi:hypothetical protein